MHMSKILILEGDEIFGNELSEKLRAARYETHVAHDGISGFQSILEWKPDLVLLDSILAQSSGYEVLEKIQKDKQARSVPVILITNSGEPTEINRALALGVKDYFVKGKTDFEEIVNKIQMQFSGGVKQKRATDETRIVEEAPGDAMSQKNSPLSSKRIVWVEDDSFLADLITRKLSSLGATLMHAGNGEEAEKIISTKKPDLILLDILLPGMDGYELLKKLKADQELKKIPVILLSNLGQREEVEKGKLLGATRFLIKATVTLDDIVAEIQSVLNGQKA